MKGLFIPDITVEMFRNASVESVAELITEGKVYDIDYCECSECKVRVWMNKSVDQKWNYCPNCGLRMESEVQNG